MRYACYYNSLHSSKACDGAEPLYISFCLQYAIHVIVYPAATQAAPLKSYRPVILMHGVLSGPSSMEVLKLRIQSAHPGTEVLNVDAYNNIVSHFMFHCTYFA